MKILIIGHRGKMGSELLALAMQQGHTCLGIDEDNRENAKSFAPDIAIDFSTSAALKENLWLCKKKNCPIVIGTTNHSAKNIKLINEFGKSLPVFVSANFSPLFYLFSKMCETLVKIEGYGYLLSEVHHKNKVDHPSGSLKTLDQKLKGRGIDAEQAYARVGGVVGQHSLEIYGENERLKIEHIVFSRREFCQGSLMAARFLARQKSGVYGMKDLMK